MGKRIAVSVQNLRTGKTKRYPSLSEAFKEVGCTAHEYKVHLETGWPIKGQYVITQRRPVVIKNKRADDRYVKTYVIYKDGTRKEFNSEAELAKELYVSKPTVYRYLNGFDLNKSVIRDKVKEVGYL